MSQTTLALSAAGSLAASLLYLYVGHVLRQRPVSQEARLANGMFVLWWQALGYLGLLGVVAILAYMAGALEIWVYQAYTMLSLLALVVALWGLQFYLVYLYTGSRRWFVPLGVFYAALFALIVGLVQRIGDPERIVDDGWQLRTEPQVELGLAFSLVFILLIVGPQLVAAAAYLRLYFKTDDRTHRYRIALVAASILVWFGSSILATAFDASESVAWRVLSRLLGVAGAVVILMAYKPPAWIRERYGIRASNEDPPPARPSSG